MEIGKNTPQTSYAISITELSMVGEARRNISSFCGEVIVDETLQGKLAIIVTELASNLVKHAGAGQIVVTKYKNFVDVFSLDRGPGISDLSESMHDGFSTTGTSGNGLGAVRRAADVFDMYSAYQAGTVVFARLFSADAQDRDIPLSGISVPISGETVCGDSFAFDLSPTRSIVMLCDGLGHGPHAFDAAELAVATFEKAKANKPSLVITALHGALRATRGAAVSVMQVNPLQNVVDFSGVGNVAGMVYDLTTIKRLVCHNGTVGHLMKHVQDFSYPFAHDPLFILHSDGIQSRWDFSDYPGLGRKSPGIYAGLVYRDFTRGRDDSTVVVWKSST